MAIKVCLEEILKERYFLQCDVGDILKFDGNLEEDENEG